VAQVADHAELPATGDDSQGTQGMPTPCGLCATGVPSLRDELLMRRDHLCQFGLLQFAYVLVALSYPARGTEHWSSEDATLSPNFRIQQTAHEGSRRFVSDQ
jgi:hypothetical protein